MYSKYIKKWYNLISNNTNIIVKNGQKAWIDIFQRRYLTGHQASEKVLSITNHQEREKKWYIITCTLEWLKRLEIMTVGEDMEKREPMCTSLLLLLSWFNHVQLCATPYMAAHEAPPSLGFSRQEHWSELQFPSPMHESEKWKCSCSVMSDS